jgi:hypothetical protein
LCRITFTTFDYSESNQMHIPVFAATSILCGISYRCLVFERLASSEKPWGRSGSVESRGRGPAGPLEAARRQLRGPAGRVRSASAGRDKKQEMAAR